MAGMGSKSNGNGGAQRGAAERPTAAPPADADLVGEALIKKLLASRKGEIMALFAKDDDREASYARAVAFTVGAYRKLVIDAEDSAARQNKAPTAIDEYSAAATALWAMQRKLDPGTDVYFVPYKGKVTPIISPQGVIKLAFRSGFVLAIDARAVFKGETFDYQLGSERWIKHRKASVRPTNPKEAWDLLEYAYCTVHLKGGGPPVVEVLDKADIAYHRSLSQTGQYDSSMWGKFPWEAARKTALKQALKCVPQESEISEILASEDTERGVPIPEEIWDAVKARGMVTPKERGGAGEEPRAPRPRVFTAESIVTQEDRDALIARAVDVADDRQQSLPALAKDMSNVDLIAFINGEPVPAAGNAGSARSAG